MRERSKIADGNAGQDGLRQVLDSMIALESRLEEMVELFSAETTGYLEAPTFVTELGSQVTGQREALQRHLQQLGDTEVPPAPAAISAALEAPEETDRGQAAEDAVGRLRAMAIALTRAAFGYAVLHGFAHRYYQVATANLADEHRINHLRAAQAVHRAVGDVVVQKLLEAGQACRCECPSCAPGICLCWHVHVEGEVTSPEAAGEGIIVRTPRAGSNAERAGLGHGDVILAIEGRVIGSYQDMLDRMNERQPGEKAKLRVRRGTREPQELVLAR